MLPIRGCGRAPQEGGPQTPDVLQTREVVLQQMLGDVAQMPSKLETKKSELQAAATCYDNLAVVTTLIFGFASSAFLKAFKTDPSDAQGSQKAANKAYIVFLILTITSALLCFALAMLQSFYFRYFITQIGYCQEKTKNWFEIVDNFRKVEWIDILIIFLSASSVIFSFTTLAIYPNTTDLNMDDAKIPASICFAVGGVCYVILAYYDGRRCNSAFNSRGNLVVNIYL
jgi:hypothetical protein